MNWLRVPTRMMFLVQLAWALLAGMGWDAVQRVGLWRTPALVGWCTGLTLLIAVGAIWSYRFPGALAVPPGSVAVAAASLAMLVGQSRVRAMQSLAPVALAVLILLEALALAPQFIAREYVSASKTPTPAVTFLRSQPGRFRVYSPHGLISLIQAVAHGIETADGNDPFQLDYYVRWANVAGGCDMDAYAVSVPTCASNEVDPEAYLHVQPDATLLGIGNVRYVVTDHALSQWPSPVWQSGSVRAYENPEALPRAFVSPTAVVEADDAAALALMQTRGPTRAAIVARAPEEGLPSGGVYREAQVTRRTSNCIDVQADGPGWLVVSEVWAPGWRASINGAQAEVYRTDVAFCGLPLPDGSHMVTLTYEPTGWVWGRWISISAAVATATITVAVLWKQSCRTSYGRRSKMSMPSDP
jgi:hypothetical protein